MALAFGVHYPEATRGLLLHWPVGGYRWKINSRARFTRHYNFTKQNGLPAAVDRARGGKSFWMDSEGGPWATEIARNHAFAETFRQPGPGALFRDCSHQWPQPIRSRYGARRRARRGSWA